MSWLGTEEVEANMRKANINQVTLG